MRRRDFIRSTAVISGASAALPADALAWALARHARARATHSSTRLDTGWRFLRGDPAGAQLPRHGASEWEDVILPHTANVESIVTGPKGSPTWQWQGICWYRRALERPASATVANHKVFLKFDGAMNVADVYLDGVHLGTHMGGYTPFVFDVSDLLTPGPHVLAVRLDNRDNAITGPKPLEILDFNMYGGLYRHVHLIVKDRLHITDPIFADEPASGGVFVDYPEVSRERALVRVRTHVRNDHDDARRFDVRVTLLDADDVDVATLTARDLTLPARSATQVTAQLEVVDPMLWSMAAPYLYRAHVEVLAVRVDARGRRQDDGTVVDAEEPRIGIRHIAFERDAFVINGERTWLRGTNRHQEYPYVGYALSDAAQWRDAWLIKNAGFDYIRLSHYPQSPAFMDACDELGLVVMNSLPGWQYFGEDPEFARLQYRWTRELIRRDRNHACVVLWEVSLNESAMTPEFIETTQRIAHEEYPGDQMVTCGWMKGYDVFIRARQHGGCPADDPQPCIVSEYGDWEYYAQNAGLNQQDYESLSPAEQNSRQLRWHGERALLQQALNFQEAHNDNLAGAAFGDGLWVMFDYNRGYAPDIESSGVADIFRLPKYSYFFYAAQRDAGDSGFRIPDSGRALDGAMVFIASEWTELSSTRVRVFSNCEEVELRLNGRAVARQRPDRDRISTHLAHPPFSFDVGAFEAGTLEAIGFIGGDQVASHRVTTPGPIARLHAWRETSGREADTSGKDVLIAHAAFLDANEGIVPDAWENVAFGVTGDAKLVGANPFSSEAGIASIVVETMPGARAAALYALAYVNGRVLAASTPIIGVDAAPFQTTEATLGNVTLMVGGRVIASLDPTMPRFRIQGSTPPPPEWREEFRHD